MKITHKLLVVAAILLSVMEAHFAHAATTEVFHLTGESSEISGSTNGSVVTPALGPVGTLSVKGLGSITFPPVRSGSGVSFAAGGQQNTNTAFYRFTGSGVANLFNSDQGELSFYLKSKYSFAERATLPSYNYRFAFDATDGTNKLFRFYTYGTASRLQLCYATGGVDDICYYIPAGQEDAVFGKNIAMKVRLTWDGNQNSLYINDELARTATFTKKAATWGVLSTLLIGGRMSSYGDGYFSSDDAIDEFRIHSGSPAGAGTPTSIPTPAPTPTPIPTPASTPTPAPVIMSGAITSVRVDSTTQLKQENVPFTFGQIFITGDFLATEGLVGKLTNGNLVPLQVDVKATHPNGSVRHAVISGILPTVSGSESQVMGLMKTTKDSSPGVNPESILNAGFTASAKIKLDGEIYTASADAALRSGSFKTWLSGPRTNEWLMKAPLTTAGGLTHPHLVARFAIRSSTGINKARVDVTIENNWAYEPNPQNFTYDAEVIVGGVSVYSKTALTHYHHARFRKVFWWGTTPEIDIKQNPSYLISTKALPNYDQSVVVSESALSSLKNSWTGSRIEPMGSGAAMAGMPTTGGRPDIGLLPAWSAIYLLSMDKRAKDVMLGTADLAGSWSSHYRDKNTDRPISLFDYPYMTTLGNPSDTVNPRTKMREAFPLCASGKSCTNPNIHDSSHQPAFAYLPYLVTGDYYYLEELQFWAMWNVFSSNPGYRENIKGLIKSDQLRGSAWSLRTLAEAAYITPDNDPLKSQLGTFLSNNLDWYNREYTNNSNANKLGVISHGYAIIYNNNTGLAPWQDDFFTSAVGHANELGFEKAQPLLAWKAKFSIDRMIDPGFCWVVGSIYTLNVRNTATSSIYSTLGEAYHASKPRSFTSLPCGGQEMAANLGIKAGEMTGYSSSNTGFPSNMQPGLAYSVDSGIQNSAKAWHIFMGRSVKPDYQNGPQFAVVPRSLNNSNTSIHIAPYIPATPSSPAVPAQPSPATTPASGQLNQNSAPIVSNSTAPSAGGGGNAPSRTFEVITTGGGAARTTTSTAVPTLNSPTAEVRTNIAAPASLLTKTLSLGSREREVTILQRMLARNPSIYPEGLITGYYGPATVRAVKNFQKKYSIVRSGTPRTTGYGATGPKTRAKLIEIFGVR
jgi:hypothetical protein